MSTQNEKNKGILLPSKQFNRDTKSDPVNMAGLIDRLNALSVINTSSHCKSGEKVQQQLTLSISTKHPSFHPIPTEDNYCDYTPMTTTTDAYAYNMIFDGDAINQELDNKLKTPKHELPYITDSPIPQFAENPNKHYNSPNYTPSTVTYNEFIDASYPDLYQDSNIDKLTQNMTKLSQSTSLCICDMDDVLMVFEQINDEKNTIQLKKKKIVDYKHKKKHSHSKCKTKYKSKRKYNKKSKRKIKHGYSKSNDDLDEKFKNNGYQYIENNKNLYLKPIKSNPFY